jgi:hypothetical protein
MMPSPSIARTLATAMALAIAPFAGAVAQTSIADRGASGARESARFVDRTPKSAVTGLVLAPSPQYKLLLIPSALGADGGAVYGARFGFINLSRISTVPFQVRAGYSRLALDDVDDHDLISVDGKIRAINGETIAGRPTTLSFLGSFQRTLGLVSRMEATAAAERALDQDGSWSVGLNASLLYSKVDAAEGKTALGAAAGLAYAIGDQTEFDLDYQFKNGIDDEDDYSFAVVQLLTKAEARLATSLLVGASKHRTVFATVVLVRAGPTQ